MTQQTDGAAREHLPVSVELQGWLRTEASRLAGEYRADRPAGVSRLAQLRKPGKGLTDPGNWEALEGLPQACVGRGDKPSRAELAGYSALALFALHQQSHRDRSMHENGASIGTALRRIGGAGDLDPALDRRFKALGTAASMEAAVRHLRGLVAMLKRAGVPLDYGRLAKDLFDLQHPETARAVRLRWGRDFYTRSRPQEPSPSQQTPPPPNSEENQ